MAEDNKTENENHYNNGNEVNNIKIYGEEKDDKNLHEGLDTLSFYFLNFLIKLYN